MLALRRKTLDNCAQRYSHVALAMHETWRHAWKRFVIMHYIVKTMAINTDFTEVILSQSQN